MVVLMVRIRKILYLDKTNVKFFNVGIRFADGSTYGYLGFEQLFETLGCPGNVLF
jgi:hypothetical protein